MPELPEVKIMSEFINVNINKQSIKEVKEPKINGKPVLSSIDLQLLDKLKNVNVRCYSRGKELMLHFQKNINKKTFEIPVTFTLGMSGNWQLIKNNENQKHERFQVITQNNNKIVFIDPRRFGKWRIDNFNFKRSPDIYQNFNEYLDFVNNLNTKKLDKRIIDTILDQSIFNGVGTYIASELINRSNFNPFATTYQFIINRNNLNLLYQIIDESYNLGGGNFQTWNNPNNIQKSKESFENWTQFYRKKDKCFKIKTKNRWLWIKNKWLPLAEKSDYVIKTFI